jgi:hypothetical protein
MRRTDWLPIATRLALVAISLLLLACGGGDGGGPAY